MMNDSDIVELYWQRSERAIRETDKKYGGYCRAIAYNICGNGEDAEECVNDTWLGAWNSMPDQRPDRLPPFLGAITRSAAINRFRAARRLKRGGGQTVLALEELAECVPAGTDVEREVEAQELRRCLDAFVAALPETERKIFVARYWFLSPVGEIAGRLGCSAGKVKTSLYRTRGRLRDYLEKEGLC